MSRAPDAIDKLVAQNIRIQRISRGITQAKLGALLGITLHQVRKYEIGVNRVSIGRLVRIAKCFKLPVMTLFDGADRAPPGQSRVPPVADRDAFWLDKAFSKIHDSDLRILLVEFVEKLAARFPRSWLNESGRNRRRKKLRSRNHRTKRRVTGAR